jgi:SRSO17 transposase
VDRFDDHEVAACGSVTVAGWYAQMLELWLDWFAGGFGRVELRRTAWAYVQGLASSLSRKNCWWLAETAGHATPGRMQHLLCAARWDADRLRDRLHRLIAARVAVPDGVLIVDETGFAKKGTTSVAVARQYSGTLGRVDNCQVGVFLTYATSRLRLLADRVLYLPKTWTDDPQRCAVAGVPADVVFATRAALALVMIRRAVTAGITAAWVTADEAYGRDGKFRTGVRALGMDYVVAVARNQYVTIGGARHRVDVATANLPATAWQTYSCGLGSKGPRWYQWAQIAIDDRAHPGAVCRILIRRGTDGTLAYYLTCTQTPKPLAVLAAVAGRRWSVEETFQISKDAFGLDEYQTRSWHGWHRHTTLTMITLAMTVAVTATDQPEPATTSHDLADPDRLDPPTVNEVHRMIAAIIIATRHVGQTWIRHLQAWSHWRQRHHATARAAHYRTRLTIDTC